MILYGFSSYNNIISCECSAWCSSISNCDPSLTQGRSDHPFSLVNQKNFRRERLVASLPVSTVTVAAQLSSAGARSEDHFAIMDEFTTPLRMRCRIAFAVTGLVVGLSIFICFIATEQFYNLHIALWGLASGKCREILTIFNYR